MKYFIIESVFNEPLPEEKVERGIAAHLAYLEKGFGDGTILVSGPKAEGRGGFIVMKAETRDAVEQYIAEDPMKTMGIQEYSIKEFMVHKAQPSAAEWFAV